MARTNELRKLVTAQLKTLCSNVYYRVADQSNLYPHIVFCMKSTYLPDLNRTDYTMDIDVWTKEQVTAEDLADNIEDLFNGANIPQETICPTFYISNRTSIPDEDKTICHVLVKVVAQNYER